MKDTTSKDTADAAEKFQALHLALTDRIDDKVFTKRILQQKQ